MNHAWVRRRTKQGMAARLMASANRELRRRKNEPLPITVRRHGVVCDLTVTIGPQRDELDEEDWEDD